jgi:hypothetical protein
VIYTVTTSAAQAQPSGMGAVTQPFNAKLDVSRGVNTGPQNVPQHVMQPVILYLGRAA